VTTTPHPLPQQTADLFLADGGLETTLVFEDGFDLPDFAAFVLLDDPAGRAALDAYYDRYAAVAARAGVGLTLDTATWRASTDWGARLGHSADDVARLNQDAVAMVEGVRARHPETTIVISGVIGPRSDGYQPTELMTVGEAGAYHGLQASAFAAAGVDFISAITMTYPEEAIGVADAARAAGLPVVVSFTVETDGRLPTGARLGAAIEAVDAATGGYPSYYMINCAHPTHFASELATDAPWVQRIGGLRANASMASHAELDEAEELDGGDPVDLAERYAELRRQLPHLTVLGGCCGTNHVHIEAIADRFVALPSES
jgi:S-methylmethionine-dependent homocysteine/selenocysteine methylase